MRNLAILAALALAPSLAAAQQKELNELLAADRAYSSAAAKTDLTSGVSAMFADDVVMVNGPTRSHVWGKEKVTDALKAVPANAHAKVEWTPVRAGISADGQQGFTFGYMTVRDSAGTEMPLKYLAYWVKQAGGWRVAAYKRSRRPPGAVSMEMLAPSVPVKTVAPVSDAAVIEKHKLSLAAAEQAFSDESAVIGVGPAFAKWGHDDAMNMGSKPEFTIGAKAISESVEVPPITIPSELTWKSDQVIVASSGDLGVSIGIIRRRDDPSVSIPFFTVWRKGTDGKWKYIAE
jgi:ketosteroid isomerase-like protein